MVRLHLGHGDQKIGPESRVRQIEFAEARNLSREAHLGDIVDVEIREDLFEFWHDAEVAGGVGEVERVAAMPGSFGDAHAGGSHGGEGFVCRVYHQRMGIHDAAGFELDEVGLEDYVAPANIQPVVGQRAPHSVVELLIISGGAGDGNLGGRGQRFSGGASQESNRSRACHPFAPRNNVFQAKPP